MSLAEFLLARIAEDEASAGNWLRFEIRDGVPGNYVIAERVLAECEAKRRIVEHHQHWQQSRTSTFEGWTEDTATAYRMAMEWVVEQLADVYAERPEDVEPGR